MREINNPPVVVVTGASAGIGRAVVREFAKKQARIGLISRNETRLQAAQKEVEDLGGKALVLPADVSDYEAMAHAADRVEQELGPIDIWVNNAMTTVFSRFLDMTPEEFKRVNEVTYLGFVYGTKIAIDRMKSRNRGTIVQVGSALAYRGIPLQSAYCGAKHAIEGFTESIRTELMHDQINIHLTMVHLPGMNTPQFRWCKNNLPHESQPVPPVFQPEVAARAIVWSAYHNRREIVVGFMNWIIIWGNKFLPSLGDWYLQKTAFGSQQMEKKKDPERPYNLWETVEKDVAAHGVFDDKAKDQSPWLRINEHRGLAWTSIGVIILIIVLLLAL